MIEAILFGWLAFGPLAFLIGWYWTDLSPRARILVAVAGLWGAFWVGGLL